MSVQTSTAETVAIGILRRHGGLLRTSQAIALGIHPRTWYSLRDSGAVVPVTRGVYRLADLPPLSAPDLIAVALRAPQAVVCLISALAFHEITTQIPHEVSIALPRLVRQPRIQHPPVRVFRYSGACLVEGVETHTIDGVTVRVFNPAKTVADCFKFRNKIGLEVALEALRFCLERKGTKPDGVLRYARVCRVEKIMLPYLEAIWS
ncbi:MAG: type IV toxin-antitoxin system AbiEi family antitoxin domain-containing protein [Candidatus Wallbacteria bacterium]|nr:type IV toxin-antitoxin system AbiEi family antitoxin domain-containing protein [Candidatus Wallbacteria bacterium]